MNVRRSVRTLIFVFVAIVLSCAVIALYSNLDYFNGSCSVYSVNKCATSKIANDLPSEILEKTSTNSPKSVYPNRHPFEFSINEISVCSRDNSRVLVVVVVFSSVGNLGRRSAIRQTWGSAYNLRQWEARLIFMLGVTQDDRLQAEVLQESAKFRDILQEDFLDSYRNLTLKSIAMLKWARKYCLDAKFIFKTDDDIFINIRLLNRILSTIPPNRTLVGSEVVNGEPLRDKRSRWYTSIHEFPGKVYPYYLSGGAYAISMDLVQDLYNVTLYTKFLSWEDTYITGLCAGKLFPKYIHHNMFLYFGIVLRCSFQDFVAVHGYGTHLMHRAWTDLKSEKCKPNNLNMFNL